MLALVFAIFAVASHPRPASAGDGMDGEAVVGHIFEVADTDGDGALSDAEFAEARLADYGLSFEESDTNQDGVLAFEEYLDLYIAHHPPIEES